MSTTQPDHDFDDELEEDDTCCGRTVHGTCSGCSTELCQGETVFVTGTAEVNYNGDEYDDDYNVTAESDCYELVDDELDGYCHDCSAKIQAFLRTLNA